METFWQRVSEEKENIRFHQAASYSPYSEFSRNWIKEEQGIVQLSVNAFYRYDEIMESLFSSKNITKEQQNRIFDIYMHYLTELEYRNGVTKQELEIKMLHRELASGRYGELVKASYCQLGKDEKYYVSHMLYQQKETRESVDKCADVLVTVLHDGIVYKNENNKKQLLLYINKRENEKDKAAIDMICELFLPLGYELRVFWENHFAVIGETQTMLINEIELL